MSKVKGALKAGLDVKQVKPRELAAIQAEYVELRSRAGEHQYQIHVLNKELERINQALEGLNYEAAARQKLDKESKPEVTTEAPSGN